MSRNKDAYSIKKWLIEEWNCYMPINAIKEIIDKVGVDKELIIEEIRKQAVLKG